MRNRRHAHSDASIIVGVAGLGGAIGSTLATGLAAWPDFEDARIGMVTESTTFRELGINLTDPNAFRLLGWDINPQDLYSAASQLKICPGKFLQSAKRSLGAIKPRRGITSLDNITQWIKNEVEVLKREASRIDASAIIIINLCPTEPFWSQSDDDERPAETSYCKSGGNQPFSPSRAYFRLAIEAGAHFINFTPNRCFTENLRQLAEKKNIVYCGSDAKTGQTYMKSVVAPAIRDRNLLVEGWYSLNLLGNADGETLSDTANLRTKVRTKAAGLEQILGYAPTLNGHHTHKIHIHYYPPRADNKEAWDNIDIRGYLGTKMQLKLNFLARDSILAAPLALDLIRLVTYLHDHGYRGAAEELSFFFKEPLANSSTEISHDSAVQLNSLLSLLKRIHLDS